MVIICVLCGYSYWVDKIYFCNVFVCLLVMLLMYFVIDIFCVFNYEIFVVLGFGVIWWFE